MYELVGGNAPEVEVTVRPQGHRRQKRHVSVISDRRWIQILDYDTLLTHPASKSRRFSQNNVVVCPPTSLPYVVATTTISVRRSGLNHRWSTHTYDMVLSFFGVQSSTYILTFDVCYDGLRVINRYVRSPYPVGNNVDTR